MIVMDELRKLGIEPYILDRDEYEKHYANSYNVLALAPNDLYYAAHDIILEYQLRQYAKKAAGLINQADTQVTTLRAENERLRAALQKISDTAQSWEGRKEAPYWNLGDIARAALAEGGE